MYIKISILCVIYYEDLPPSEKISHKKSTIQKKTIIKTPLIK